MAIVTLVFSIFFFEAFEVLIFLTTQWQFVVGAVLNTSCAVSKLPWQQAVCGLYNSHLTSRGTKVQRS